MSTDSDADWLYDMVLGWDGLFVGSLSRHEIELFDRACEAGVARRVYRAGIHALLGLPTVKAIDPADPPVRSGRVGACRETE